MSKAPRKRQLDSCPEPLHLAGRERPSCRRTPGERATSFHSYDHRTCKVYELEVSPFRFSWRRHLIETLAKALIDDIRCIACRFGRNLSELVSVRQVFLKSPLRIVRMLCELLVQGAGRRREITDMCRKLLGRLPDEIQLAKPDCLDPIESKLIGPQDGLNVLALARKHRPALLRARVRHVPSPR